MTRSLHLHIARWTVVCCLTFGQSQPSIAGEDTPLLAAENVQLHAAARSNNVADLKAFGDKLAHGLNSREAGSGQTPLMAATLAGADESAKFLLDNGADATIGEQDGYTPFHGAGFQGRAAVAKHLLGKGLNPSDRHTDGSTPLHRACWGSENRHTEMVQFLLMNGVDVGETDSNGKTCLDMTRNEATRKLCKRWLKHLVVRKPTKKKELLGASEKPPAEEVPLLEAPKTEIHRFARENSLKDLEGLGSTLEKVLNVREPGTGQTPLMAATLAGADQSVKFLLERGADATIAEKDGYTPFHGAGFQGRAAVAKELLAHGLNPSDLHTDGSTPLHRACWGREKRHTEMVEFLLMNGVDVEEEDNKGKTCLDLTANEKTKKLCKRWLKYLVVKNEL